MSLKELHTAESIELKTLSLPVITKSQESESKLEAEITETSSLFSVKENEASSAFVEYDAIEIIDEIFTAMEQDRIMKNLSKFNFIISLSLISGTDEKKKSGRS